MDGPGGARLTRYDAALHGYVMPEHSGVRLSCTMPLVSAVPQAAGSSTGDSVISMAYSMAWISSLQCCGYVYEERTVCVGLGWTRCTGAELDVCHVLVRNL